jgi:hypothetical protein
MDARLMVTTANARRAERTRRLQQQLDEAHREWGFRIMRVVTAAVVGVLGLLLGACQIGRGSADFQRGYSYGYHHWDPNNFAYYQACNDAPIKLQMNSLWQDGCSAGTDAARLRKGYAP